MVKDSPVHVTTQRRHYVGKDGVERVYETHLLRRSFREDGKVRNETVANLSHVPTEAIDVVRSVLAGKTWWRPASVSRSPGRCRTGTSPRCGRWRSNSACPRCSARPAGCGTWRWR